MKNLREINLKEKRVLVRCDFNVPLSETEPRNSGVKVKMRTKFSSPEGAMAKRTSSSSLSSSLSEPKILDDFRIEKTIPTIQYLIEQGAKVILMSHLGRPDGKVVESLRLTPIQDKLMEYLDLSIAKAQDCVGPEIEKWTKKMKPGEVLLLENVQFNPGEKKNDLNFARTLASYGDIFVMEAFGQAHRNYASIASIPKYLPSVAGLLFEKEISTLTKLSTNPEKPLVAIIGGAKVETKAGLINKISEVADFVLIGHLIEKELKEKGIKLNHPEKIVSPVDGPGGKDIGPRTVEMFKEKISRAKTVFFNGVLGKVEEEEFAKGTEEILEAIAQSQAFSVLGGGDMTKVIIKLGLTEKFGHISTGGGAMIAFLAGEELPGIKALK